ncbi:putative transposase [Candidatus Gugararchaeum adminiculabundum]|nr:putative transposase [Candidatus Gugararchaeum adminiculabundum]
MGFVRSYKFRVYPSKTQEKQMLQHLWLAKNLWNELLEHCKKMYEEFGYFPTKGTMQLMAKNCGLFSQTQQEISHRLYASVIRVFRMKQQGKICGFPRFKSFDRMKSLHYPQNGIGFHLEKKLRVNPFGEIAIKKHREINGNIKTLTLKKEASGKWFAIFCAGEPKKRPAANSGKPVGIDLGLLNFAALSTGEIIHNPRHLRRYEQKLAVFKKRFSRKKKKSRNRHRAKLKVARIYGQIANSRSDFLHKLSKRFVSDYSLIVLEKLASKEMSEQNFGKSINDAGWIMFANMLCYKAEEAGSRVVFVNPIDTTKECSSCGTKTSKSLAERIHVCSFCGLNLDRDVNAARVILKRATAGTAGSNASGNETIVSSMKEEAASVS